LYVQLVATVQQSAYGAIAKRLCSGLQSRLGRFDSGSRLQQLKKSPDLSGLFFLTIRLRADTRPTRRMTIGKIVCTTKEPLFKAVAAIENLGSLKRSLT
jgi:hypothetical protein